MFVSGLNGIIVPVPKISPPTASVATGFKPKAWARQQLTKPNSTLNLRGGQEDTLIAYCNMLTLPSKQQFGKSAEVSKH